MNIYVASSWRNLFQPQVVALLRSLGQTVYDFRNPFHPQREGGGFMWSDIDGDWQRWSPAQYRKALEHSIARQGFKSDMEALENADMCLLVLPCGRSAHLELGFAVGQRKKTAVYYPDALVDMAVITQPEPELMNKMCDRILLGEKELAAYVGACSTYAPKEGGSL